MNLQDIRAEFALMDSRSICIATAIIVVAILLIALLIWSWKKYHLGDYMHHRSTFCGAPPMSAAHAEARGLMETGWRPNLQLPTTHYLAHPESLTDDVDDYAARKIHRDKSTFTSIMNRAGGNKTNPAHISARQARHNSMRGTFSSPDGTDGWEDPQATIDCVDNCMDGCGGTNCRDHCKDRCQSII